MWLYTRASSPARSAVPGFIASKRSESTRKSTTPRTLPLLLRCVSNATIALGFSLGTRIASNITCAPTPSCTGRARKLHLARQVLPLNSNVRPVPSSRQLQRLRRLSSVARSA
uniref:(northern house mosquito) hypothetical protein n=1 Tax=Culex pipiens TaxID=7175 RepID=A0A8D8PHY9_CULPI